MQMTKGKRSRSSEQSKLEVDIRDRLSKQLNIVLRGPKDISLGSTHFVCVDAYSLDPRILVEIYSHQGGLKDGQKKKVSQDILKLATIRNTNPNWREARLIMALGSKQALRSVKDSWLSVSADQFNVELQYVELPLQSKTLLSEVQKRQDLTRDYKPQLLNAIRRSESI